MEFHSKSLRLKMHLRCNLAAQNNAYIMDVTKTEKGIDTHGRDDPNRQVSQGSISCSEWGIGVYRFVRSVLEKLRSSASFTFVLHPCHRHSRFFIP